MKDVPKTSSFSLVKYSKPILEAMKVTKSSSFSSQTSTSLPNSNSEIVSILNSILPPKGY